MKIAPDLNARSARCPDALSTDLLKAGNLIATSAVFFQPNAMPLETE
jgi:hypothetical protein